MDSRNPNTIACIGGIVQDRKARVFEPIAPGSSNPVTVGSCPGGVACNIARNLAKLGCGASIFSAIGRDAAGDRILEDLKAAGVDASGVTRSAERPTANYTAVLDEKGQLFIGLADMDIFEELDPRWADTIAPAIQHRRFWILDANLPAATIERLLRTHKNQVTVIVDPISVAKSARIFPVLDAIDVLFPNAKEAAVLSGREVKTSGDVAQAAAELRRRGVGAVIVTLGDEGIYIDDSNGARFVPAIPAERVVDVTGAGDALLAGYAYALFSGESHDPVLWGLAAASLTVETAESIAPGLSRDAILRRIAVHVARTAAAKP